MKEFIILTMTAGVIFGCSGAENTPPVVDTALVSVCPDDGPTLPGTGICAGRAVNYMNIVEGDAPDIPENCDWTVNETAFAGDYLLYLAATCDGKKAKLGYAGGAHFAHLTLDWSAVVNASLEDTVLVMVTGADMEDPRNNILYYARDAMDDGIEAKKCSVRSTGTGGWPVDALVVDISADEAAKAPKDGPRSACGPFGLNEDETAYWRIFQGFSWWFQFSQDAYQDIDPRSLTLLTSDGNGGWMTIE